jgi:ribosomal protein S18 acetylase RimI-like enzyme
MEFANLWPKGEQNNSRVRIAARSDAAGIRNLLQTAVFTHLHVDWYLPGDWIGSSGFVIIPDHDEENLSSRLFGPRPTPRACLAAAPDPAPAAWVRIAAVSEDEPVAPALTKMLAHVIHSLQKTGVNTVAWLAIQEWPIPILKSLGFNCVNEIETYVKDNDFLPEIPRVSGLTIRAVTELDMSHLEDLEKLALNPIWRHSARGLILARHQAISFDVAELQGQLVGFQLSTPSECGVHLVRLTVDPTLQRSGIGTALLGHAIRRFHENGRYHITLNTQIDNTSSQYLYRKFGFQPNGQRFPVWVKRL